MIVTGTMNSPSDDLECATIKYEALPPTNYCTAKMNSCGLIPQLSFAGTPSASSSSGFTVQSSKAQEGRLGLLMYTNLGRSEPAVAFHGGLLCIAAPIRRGPVVTASGGNLFQCNSTFSLDLNAFAAGTAGGSPASFLSLPGIVVDCQWWGRDTVANGAYLSDALEYTIQP